MTDKVLDFVGKRKENIEQKRRSFERVLFQNFLGAYTVIDQDGTNYPVDLIDISHDGCQFQVPWNAKKDAVLPEGHEVTLRVYFTQSSYIPVSVEIKRSQEQVSTDGRVFMQYGCQFDKTTTSFEAMQSFIDFMYKFSEFSCIDKGDQRVYFL